MRSLVTTHPKNAQAYPVEAGAAEHETKAVAEQATGPATPPVSMARQALRTTRAAGFLLLAVGTPLAAVGAEVGASGGGGAEFQQERPTWVNAFEPHLEEALQTEKEIAEHLDVLASELESLKGVGARWQGTDADWNRYALAVFAAFEARAFGDLFELAQKGLGSISFTDGASEAILGEIMARSSTLIAIEHGMFVRDQKVDQAISNLPLNPSSKFALNRAAKSKDLGTLTRAVVFLEGWLQQTGRAAASLTPADIHMVVSLVEESSRIDAVRGSRPQALELSLMSPESLGLTPELEEKISALESSGYVADPRDFWGIARMEDAELEALKSKLGGLGARLGGIDFGFRDSSVRSLLLDLHLNWQGAQGERLLEAAEHLVQEHGATFSGAVAALAHRLEAEAPGSRNAKTALPYVDIRGPQRALDLVNVLQSAALDRHVEGLDVELQSLSQAIGRKLSAAEFGLAFHALAQGAPLSGELEAFDATKGSFKDQHSGSEARQNGTPVERAGLLQQILEAPDGLQRLDHMGRSLEAPQVTADQLSTPEMLKVVQLLEGLQSGPLRAELKEALEHFDTADGSQNTRAVRFVDGELRLQGGATRLHDAVAEVRFQGVETGGGPLATGPRDRFAFARGGQDGLVVTTFSHERFNIDFVNTAGVVVDLGLYELTPKEQ